jgi:DNA-binding NarL/FixJ family response regulator
MLAVVVAIQDELPRLGIEAALEATDAARVVASVDSPESLFAVLDEHQPRVLLLDVRFRRADATLLPALSRNYPSCRVLMYVAHTAQQCALRHLLRAGGRAQLSPGALRRIDECCLTSLRRDARGCLPSEASADDVVQAVTAVAVGQVVAAPWLSAFAEAGMGSASGKPAITVRELEVMALLAKGLGNKAIARELGIREKTVKNHATRLMAKLGLRSRTQVGVVAARYHVRVRPRDEDD